MSVWVTLEIESNLKGRWATEIVLAKCLLEAGIDATMVDDLQSTPLDLTRVDWATTKAILEAVGVDLDRTTLEKGGTRSESLWSSDRAVAVRPISIESAILSARIIPLPSILPPYPIASEERNRPAACPFLRLTSKLRGQ